MGFYFSYSSTVCCTPQTVAASAFNITKQKMHTISEVSNRLRILQAKLYNFFHIFPFSWNSDKKAYITDVTTKYYFELELYLVPLSALFQTFQLFRYIRAGKYNGISYLYLVWIVGVLHSFHIYVLQTKLSEYISFVNGTLFLGHRISSTFLP